MLLTGQGALDSCPHQEETRDKGSQLWLLGLVHQQASWPLSTLSGQDVSLSEEESQPESPFIARRGTPSRARNWALV